MKLTQFATNAMNSVTSYAKAIQRGRIAAGDPMNASELRENIQWASKYFDLHPDILEGVARNIEEEVGVVIYHGPS
jgi:hypothetical protein